MILGVKKSFFKPRKSVAKCPRCLSKMVVIRKHRKEHIDEKAEEHLCYQYVVCTGCGAKGKTTSHTTLFKNAPEYKKVAG